MVYKVKDVYVECIRYCFGLDDKPTLGGTDADTIQGSLSEKIKLFLYAEFNDQEVIEKSDNLLPHSDILYSFYKKAETAFLAYYSQKENNKLLQEKAQIIFNSKDEKKIATAIAILWSPELYLNDDNIFNSWKLSQIKQNPTPYKPDEVIIQLNALYSPAEKPIENDVSIDLIRTYNKYLEKSPKKIAVYDHPVPVFTRGKEHELEKCLAELDLDIEYEKDAGVFPLEKKLSVLISISTTHENLDEICEIWLKEVITELKIKHLDCYLLSENKARNLSKILGSAGDIFTVQGKYACHFGALKYAQLIFEKAIGIKAGFKLDTDEGIHTKEMQKVSGKTWLEQLCHPYWGGRATSSQGKNVYLGFNIGEYVDSRDLDKLGYAKAINTPEVNVNNDLRGPFLLFCKGACQAKGTELLNRSKSIEDFISHPLVKGGGYGIDNDSLRKATPVGFSITGRAEDQQFYFSALGKSVQGIFNPLLRIIHYKADVIKSENKNEVTRNIADIYRMILFKELMSYLDVIKNTEPFPANFASPLSNAQVFWLWLNLIFQASLKGHESEAKEYLLEGINELSPLIEDIRSGLVLKKFEEERTKWTSFIDAVSKLTQKTAKDWISSLKI